MKLGTALAIIGRQRHITGQPFNAALLCGFTPLHLATFLRAHLSERHPGRPIVFHTGLFDDLVGSLLGIEEQTLDAVFVAVEWSDLDPRLGLRRLGGWSPRSLGDVVAGLATRLDQIASSLTRAGQKTAIAVSLPTLPLVPISHAAGYQDDLFALDVRAHVAEFARRVARSRGIRVLGQQRLHRLSPLASRHDVGMDLQAAFPYSRTHAAHLAELLVSLACPPAAKKGLITDLDDTLWRGIVGEVGPAGVTWDIDNHSQIHGLYQQLLAALGAAGVLLAVASKNHPDLVSQALGRDDALVSADTFFPIEAGWGPKSEAVARILATWNVSADSVLFVDDSAMELDEVATAHPDLECVRFPTGDAAGFYALMETLRDRLGKPTVGEEDALRLDSIRSGESLRRELGQRGAPSERFLADMQSALTLDFTKNADRDRPLALINKTNQFNLNGRRFSESAWADYLTRAETRTLTVSYRDKYGQLGIIATMAFRVIAGPAEAGAAAGPSRDDRAPGHLCIDTWVMSCRAFARRIEHRCLEQLFERFDVARITFDYQETERNGPLQSFLAGLIGDLRGRDSYSLGRDEFLAKLPPLYSAVEECSHG
ncbi:MAG: HAD-IIIC family phosphatase [Proteobacteria bacterium]|nr:HAD-IIIC family phosphatase [Pseudomonadota bacterium]